MEPRSTRWLGSPWVSALVGCSVLASGCGEQQGATPHGDAQDVSAEIDTVEVTPEPDAAWSELYGGWVPWEDDFAVPADAGPSSTRLTARPDGTVAGAPNGYWEYLPPGYGVRPPPPLIVFWHGQGQWGSGADEESLARVRVAGPPALIASDRWPNALPFVVLSPQRRENICCPPASEVRDFLVFALEHYEVDPERVYLTGFSAGAIGSWNYLAEDRDAVVDGAVLVAGDGRPAWRRAGCELGRVRTWAFHGSADENVQVAGTIEPLNALQRCADPPPFDARLTVLEGAAHDITAQTYDPTLGYDVYTWLLNGGITPPPTGWLVEDWSCVGAVEWPLATTPMADITFDIKRITGFTAEGWVWATIDEGMVPVGLRLDACPKGDIACPEPLDTAIVGSSVYVTLTVPTPGLGFDGFFRFTSDATVASYSFLIPPVQEAEPLDGGLGTPNHLGSWGRAVFAPEVLEQMAAVAGVTLDPEKGRINVKAMNCQYLRPYEGDGEVSTELEVTIDGRPPDLTVEYRSLFLNIDPGPVTIEARLPWSHELVGRVDVVVVAGAYTLALLGPTPSID